MFTVGQLDFKVIAMQFKYFIFLVLYLWGQIIASNDTCPELLACLQRLAREDATELKGDTLVCYEKHELGETIFNAGVGLLITGCGALGLAVRSSESSQTLFNKLETVFWGCGAAYGAYKVLQACVSYTKPSIVCVINGAGLQIKERHISWQDIGICRFHTTQIVTQNISTGATYSRKEHSVEVYNKFDDLFATLPAAHLPTNFLDEINEYVKNLE